MTKHSGIPVVVTQRRDGEAAAGLEEGRYSSSNPPVIDPQALTKEKKGFRFLPKGENVFLAASFAMVLIELSASLFTLSVIHFKIKPSIVHLVTVGYYLNYSKLTAILVVDSILALRRHSKEMEKGEINKKQFIIRNIKDIATVVSSIMWIALGVASLAMEFGHQTEHIRLFALFLSLAAPILGAFSAITRAYEVIYSSGVESKKLEDARKKAEEEGVKSGSTSVARSTKEGAALWVRFSLYLVIAAFETAHCMCHIYEAYLLVGETHKLFSITDQVLLGTQASLAFMFLLLLAAETILDKRDKKAIEDHSLSVPASVAAGEASTEENTQQTQPSSLLTSGSSRKEDGLSAVPPMISDEARSVLGIVA